MMIVTKEKGDMYGLPKIFPEGWNEECKPITPFELNTAFKMVVL